MKQYSTSQQALYAFLLYLGLLASGVQAQVRIGQSVSSPDGSAALDVSSGPYTTGSQYRGIAPPKVALTTSTSANPITNPAPGLLIYNTATQNDIIPGYYYWEGNKWVRFYTSSNSSSTPIGAAGDPIPAYTYSQARALTVAPGAVFMLVEPGQEGLFRNTPVVATSPGNPGDTISANGIRDANGNILSSGTVMTVGGQRYKRVITDGSINVRWFGASNIGASDASQAIQRAINYSKTLFSGNWNKAAIFIPEGSYVLNKTIDITKTEGINMAALFQLPEKRVLE